MGIKEYDGDDMSTANNEGFEAGYEKASEHYKQELIDNPLEAENRKILLAETGYINQIKAFGRVINNLEAEVKRLKGELDLTNKVAVRQANDLVKLQDPAFIRVPRSLSEDDLYIEGFDRCEVEDLVEHHKAIIKHFDKES